MPLPNAWHLASKKPRKVAIVPPIEIIPEPDQEVVGLIDINTADKSTLVRLPGIGPASADSIINARPFVSVQDMIEKAHLNRLDAQDIEIITHSATFS